jgi:hypothetical protein
MEISKEHIEEFKKLLEEKAGKEVSWEEASEGAYNLVNLMKLLLDLSRKEHGWKMRLKDEPKGFSLEGNGRTCALCKKSMSEDENWYDKWGLKCKTCQRAIDKKIIPGSILKNDKSWYSEYDLEDRFNLTKKFLNSWIKDGIIKARIIKNINGTDYCRIFLIKDNKDFLPPKELVESKMVKEHRDGKDWYHCEPWYKFVDPFEHLKGYRIMDYMKISSQLTK